MSLADKSKAVIQFYNTLSDNYDSEQESFAFVRVPEKEIVLETLKKTLSKDLSVLEIGAGTGRFTMEIAPLVKRVVTVDLADKMLAKMSEKLASQNINNVEQIHGDFLNIPFSEQFDLIVSFSAIEYIIDTEALFKKLSALTKTNGKLVITTAHNTFLRQFGRLGNYFRQKILMAAYSKKRVRKLLQKNGFVIEDLQDLALKTFLTKGILLYVLAKKS